MSGALVAVLVLLALLPPATAAASDDPAYFWRWGDGSEARTRTFAEHAYDAPSRLPHLVVQTHPATAGRKVVLQARVHGGWRTEDAASTDGRGAVRLQLNPYCENGAWCSRAFDYRLLAGGRTARLTVDFVP